MNYKTDLPVPLKAQFYIVRSNGSAIPLIAMDELPQHISIEGVPRTLTFKDVNGMKLVEGDYEARHEVHKVINNNDNATTVAVKPQAQFVSSSSSAVIIPSSHNMNQATSPATDKIFLGPKKFYGIKEQKPDSDEEGEHVQEHKNHGKKASQAFGKFETLPAWKDTKALESRFPPPGKKVYCSHWMSTGECNFAQQGCIYKHQMPTDLTLLNYLGYQDIPKWYREKYGIGKVTAIPGSGAHIKSSVHTSRNVTGPSRVNRTTFTSSMQSVRRSPGRSHTPPLRSGRMPKQKNLLEMEPMTTASASNSNNAFGKSLMTSKFAVLEPSQSVAGIFTSNTIKRSSDAADQYFADRSTDASSSSDATTVKMAGVSNEMPAYVRQARQARQDSYASDYEAVLTRELEAHDLAETEAYRQVCARADVQKQQESLKKM